MTRPRRVCLVTDEIHPLTHGGIGRLLHNLIADSRRREALVEFHLMVPRHVPVTQTQLDSVFGPGVTLHGATLTSTGEGIFPDLDRGFYPPVAAFEDLVWQAQSHQFAIELMDLERQGLVFDEIEFPDFRGHAFGAINEKRLGRGLTHTRLTVRIHSTFGAIRFFEPYPLSYRDLLVRELERKALLEADQVVAHLPAIAAFNRAFYGFDEAWLRSVRIEFPPVLDRPGAGAAQVAKAPATGAPPLVFASRSDPFKRPGLFVQAAAELMRRRPDYLGNAILACHIYHPEEIQALLAALPVDLRGRFLVQQISGEARERLIANAVVVIPSAYESLSLLAYEASECGATVVLNDSCLAFGPGSPFLDGTNCLKFDGSVGGLVGALERAIQGPSLEPVRWTAAPPYWETPAAAPEERSRQQPLISVVITSCNGGALLPETLESVLATTYENVEVVVVDDGSRDPLDTALFDRLEQQAGLDGPMRVGRHLMRRGSAASRNTGLSLARGEAILFVDSGDLLQPTLLAEAALALELHPEITGVLPTVAYLRDLEDLASESCLGFATQLGDAPTPGMLGSLSALHPVWRRTSLPPAGFDPGLGSEGIWLSYFNALLAGARFVPTPEIGYLARMPSVPESLTRERRTALLGRLAGGRSSSGVRALWIASLLLELPSKAAAVGLAAELVPARPSTPMRYNWVDLANRAIKRTGPFHRALRQALSGALMPRGSESLPRLQSRPLRHQLADRLNAALKGMPGAHRLMRRLGGGQRL